MVDKVIKVLLIEDDEEDYLLTKSMLAELQNPRYRIDWISSFDAAATAVSESEFDVCLIDYRLGVNYGTEILRLAKQSEVNKPFILLTGYGDRDVDIAAMKEGAADYLDKGMISAEILERSIRFAIERKRLEQDLLDREIRNGHAKRLESVGSLAAGIAHEINTPIQFIGDNIQFFSEAFQNMDALVAELKQLSTGLASGTALDDIVAKCALAEQKYDYEYYQKEIPKAIDQTLDGVQRVATIVKAMKDFAHPGKDEKALADINKAIQDTLTVARNELKYVADVITEFDEDLPLVWCNVGDLNQVFLNILVNAAHAISDKIGDAGEQKGTIVVRTRQENGYAVINIVDTGIGIPEEIQDRVFDHFFTTKEVGRGTGQGLAIAHSVVAKKHDGELTFKSKPGEGTEFTIRLPLKKKGAANAETASTIR